MFWRGVWGYLPANIVQGVVGFLTLVVFIEKLLPRGRRFEGALGIALVGLGIVVSLGAIEMPWVSD